MDAESKARYILYLCIPLFILFALYSQMQSARVIDIHNSIESKSPVKDSSDKSNISTFMIFIPAIGPYLEVNSITTLFSNMKTVTTDYSDKNSAKIINDMFNSYVDESDYKDPSLYLHYYDVTLNSMLEYFKNYSTLGPDSEVTSKSKIALSQSLKILQIVSVIKTILYIVIFLAGLIGFFVFKGRKSSKSMYSR